MELRELNCRDTMTLFALTFPPNSPRACSTLFVSCSPFFLQFSFSFFFSFFNFLFNFLFCFHFFLYFYIFFYIFIFLLFFFYLKKLFRLRHETDTPDVRALGGRIAADRVPTIPREITPFVEVISGLRELPLSPMQK